MIDNQIKMLEKELNINKKSTNIDSEIENLQKEINGLIDEKDYYPPINSVDANGNITLTRRVKISGIKIGDYIVDNVVVLFKRIKIFLYTLKLIFQFPVFCFTLMCICFFTFEFADEVADH